MSHLIKFFIIALSLVIATYSGLILLSKPTFIKGSPASTQIDPKKPHILLVSLTEGVGGLDTHVIKLYKMLRKDGYQTSLLVPSNTKFRHVLQELDLPHYTTHATIFHMFRPLYHFILRHCLYSLCKQEQFDIIHCNNRHEAPDALWVKRYLPIHVIFTRHMPDPFAVRQIKNIEIVVATSPLIEAYFQTENLKQHLNIGQIVYLPPLYETDKFISYASPESSVDFFKNNFDIHITADPVIVMIANFYHDLSHKNHPLLLQALKILVQKNRPIQVMLAGDGVRKVYLQNLVKELGLEAYVHFLGSTQNIPGVLHHSDMMVLASKNEAFGIVYLEAGLMKKPAIGATGTGAEAIILNEKTGLLFRNNDAQDLANQIERLIDNPEWAKELGQNAYEHVMKNFSPEVTFEKYKELYATL